MINYFENYVSFLINLYPKIQFYLIGNLQNTSIEKIFISIPKWIKSFFYRVTLLLKFVNTLQWNGCAQIWHTKWVINLLACSWDFSGKGYSRRTHTTTKFKHLLFFPCFSQIIDCKKISFKDYEISWGKKYTV